jgi:hypothetical protein
VGAATVRPESRPELLLLTALLQQYFAGSIENKYGKRPMQDAAALVTGLFRFITDDAVIGIDQDQWFTIK